MAKQQNKEAGSGGRSSISRRKFIGGMTLAATASTGLATSPSTVLGSGAAPAGVANAGAGSFAILTAEQGSLLTAVLNRLIPADGALPGAGDVGVARYIDGLLADTPHLRQPIIRLLGQLVIQGATSTSAGTNLDAYLQRSEQEMAEPFESLVHATYEGYYGHPEVQAALRHAYPSEEGHQPEFLNAELFDEVRQRGPIYRQV